MPNSTYIEQVILKKPFGWNFLNPYEDTSFSFEEVDFFYWHALIEANWAFSLIAGAVYIVTIFGLQRWMRDRPAFDLRGPLFLWNLSLGIFSIMGFVRTIPGFLYVLSKPNGVYNSVCLKNDTNIQTGYWTLLFILSKVWELGDTIFIVLRKRPLIFLQWYHHLITMTVVWVLAPLVEPIARWYTVLNYFVHSWMYPYFALKAIGIQIPTVLANVITTFQLTQMLLGFGVNMLTLLYQQAGYECVRYPISIKMFNFVYGSFILLFGKLFYESVLRSGRKRKEMREKKSK